MNLMDQRLPSNMSHDFSNVPKVKLPRASFKTTRTHKTTFNADYLVPVYVGEALPGDTWDFDMAMLARFSSPLKTPVMDNAYLDIFSFAAPLRILQTNFPKIFGMEVDPLDVNTTQTPIITPTTGGFTALSLEDYFGLPLGIEGIEVVSYWHRFYNDIWNNFFRDQNLQDSVVVDRDDGPDSYADYTLLKRGKRHDYFTSALPWPQKSDSGVTIPLGTRADVLGIGKATQTYSQGSQNVYESDGTTTNYPISAFVNSDAQDWYARGTHATTGYPDIYADLSNATAATINQLREAFTAQQLYELDARSGTRFPEFLEAHFGVSNPDSRMQRPEYLGGGSFPINVNPIAQQSQSETTKQGTLTGVAYMQGRAGFTKSFTEHCAIIVLANVRADITYQNNAIHQMFSRRDRFDFYHPILANIGEQPILNEELFAVAGTTDTGSTGTPDNKRTWGYQEAWASYRYEKSIITGQFRSDHGTPLDTWHYAEDFASLPPLNASFIVSNSGTPISRAQAVTTYPHIIFDSFSKINKVRVMPTYSVPGLERL